MRVLPYAPSHLRRRDRTRQLRIWNNTVLGGGVSSIFRDVSGRMHLYVAVSDEFSPEVGWRFVPHATTALCFECLAYLPMLFIAALTKLSSAWLFRPVWSKDKLQFA
jgi:hypothetical protein